MALVEEVAWLAYKSSVASAFAEVETVAEVQQLFLNSALQGVTSSALAPVGGQTVIPAAAEAVTVTSTGTAAEAFSTYVASGGGLSAASSAQGAVNLTQMSPVVVEKLGEAGTTGFAGPLGVLSADVGVVGAAVAPLLGVALGAGLYASNPDLWEKISRKILPFCYPDSGKVPIYIDKDGNTFIDGQLVEELQDLITEEDIGPSYKHVESPSADINYSTYDVGSTYPCNDGYFIRISGSGPIFSARDVYGNRISASIAPSNIRVYNPETHGYGTSLVTSIQYTKEGLTVYYGSSGTTGHYCGPISDFGSTLSAEEIAWEIVYGPSSEISGYPEGTSKWGTGDPYDYTQGKREVFTDPDLTTTKDIYPVALPIPDGTGDPASLPDTMSRTQPESEEQTKPYDLPDLVPFPNNTPDFNPKPNPETDPSTQPQTKPDQKIIDIIPPIDDGTSPQGPIPIVPLPSANVNGLIAVYHPTPTELYNFSRWLWVTYADASSVNKIWNNPFDGVIGCHELYCTPTDIGRQNIKCGFLDSGINSAIISRYTEINCGNIVVPEYYRNYLDYTPYTIVHVYLPFIGIVQLNADDIIGRAVNITYRIDEYNGSCIAMIKCAKITQHQGEPINFEALLYQFEGNCSVEVPLSGGSQANIKIAAMTGIMQVASSVVGGAFGGMMSGNPASAVAGGVAGLGQGLASAANALLHAKSYVQKSGQFGASYGAMGVKKPFIIVNRPVQVEVPNYNKEYGFPAHKFVTIGACSGYLRCREVNVISARATNEEKSRIEQYLKTGVFVQ